MVALYFGISIHFFCNLFIQNWFNGYICICFYYVSLYPIPFWWQQTIYQFIIYVYHLSGFQLFNLQKDSPLRTLEPSTLQALYELISLVHDGAEAVSQMDKIEATSQNKSSNQRDDTDTTAAADDSSLLDKDPVAKIILPVEPLELRTMLLAMVVCITKLKTIDWYCCISFIFPNPICARLHAATIFCC